MRVSEKEVVMSSLMSPLSAFTSSSTGDRGQSHKMGPDVNQRKSTSCFKTVVRLTDVLVELLGQGGVFVEQRQALVHPLLDHMEMRVHLRNPNISSVKVSRSWVHGAYKVRASELRASELSHLEFHLLGLLGVNGHNMLVMRECVSAVLLLDCHVSLQGLQHVLRLQDKVGQRTDSVRLIHHAAKH